MWSDNTTKCNANVGSMLEHIYIYMKHRKVKLPWLGYEPQIFGLPVNCSTNWAIEFPWFSVRKLANIALEGVVSRGYRLENGSTFKRQLVPRFVHYTTAIVEAVFSSWSTKDCARISRMFYVNKSQAAMAHFCNVKEYFYISVFLDENPPWDPLS
jgi:hypothetical protein